MVKPTKEQLKLLYPSISTEYIEDCVNRQLSLIQIEEDNLKQADVIINSYQDKVILLLVNEFAKVENLTQYNALDKQLEQLIEELMVELVIFHVDTLVQTYETSSLLQQWILEKYFTDNETMPYQEVGGEQKKPTTKVTRQKITKQKANDILTKKNITHDTQSMVNQLKQDIRNYLTYQNTKEGKKDNLKLSQLVDGVKNSFSNLSKQIKQTTKILSQNTVYDSYNDVQIEVSENYQVVYYRVEVLDSAICTSCLFVDGQINDYPLDQLHKNCRGIDIVLLKDLETGKYLDTNGSGYGHKLKTKSFESKFEKLGKKQKRRMLGKSNYEAYEQGKLKAEDFIFNGRQITKAEADTKIQLKSIRQQINTPAKATRIANTMETPFKGKNISKMDSKQLLAYEKVLGIQKQLYDLVPKKNYSKTPYQDYIGGIQDKLDKINARKLILKKGVK